MKNILEAPFIIETIRTTANMYALGWDERNSGNISLLLDETEVREYLDITNVLRVLPTGFSTESLAGKYFLVTATGVLPSSFGALGAAAGLPPSFPPI